MMELGEGLDRLAQNARATNPLVMGAQQGVPGVDVSHHQGDIDWSAVASSGVHFAYLKATDGVDWEDRRFAEHWADAKQAGLMVGAYHFGHPDSVEHTPEDDAAREAEYFVSVLRSVGYGRGDLPPALDIEWSGATGVPAAEVLRWTVTFVERLEETLGVTPVIYTGPNFWKYKLNKTQELAKYPLWEALYVEQEFGRRESIPDWPRAFWQYSPKGLDGLQGVGVDNIDKNIYEGNIVDLYEMTGLTDSEITTKLLERGDYEAFLLHWARIQSPIGSLPRSFSP